MLMLFSPVCTTDLIRYALLTYSRQYRESWGMHNVQWIGNFALITLIIGHF
jgi:hypothetical protein